MSDPTLLFQIALPSIALAIGGGALLLAKRVGKRFDHATQKLAHAAPGQVASAISSISTTPSHVAIFDQIFESGNVKEGEWIHVIKEGAVSRSEEMIEEWNLGNFPDATFINPQQNSKTGA